MRVPDGFHIVRTGATVFVCRDDLEDDARAVGLDVPERCVRLVETSTPRSGRGPVGRVTLPSGVRVVLKKLRRGGATGAIWRDRFLGTRRIAANVWIPIEVARRGIPTASPVCLLVREGPRGLFQAWLAAEEISEAEDLRGWLARSGADLDPVLAETLVTVRRMHDAGVDHRDLNLGNLLVRKGPARWESFVVDLDRARIRKGPLGFRARQEAIRRIVRSYVKVFGETGPLGGRWESAWYDLYADRDDSLAVRLRSGRDRGRFWLAWHRLGWRLRGSSASSNAPTTPEEPER